MVCLQKEEKNYPKMLRNIKNAPQELYIEGNLKCVDLPCITVVGSRNMSEYGRMMTKKIVKDLTLAGICIVSGLAIGVDSVAHQTCLENGGKTIAVLGSGLNKVYPKENIKLYNDILNCGGCVMSEQEPNQEPDKMFFPARNRIVSGLSLGTVVIEATYRSGTSITAKFALEQGRKLFCVPNMVGQKNSAGTINLLKKGAIMITNAEDILLELRNNLQNYNCYRIKAKMIKKRNIDDYKNIEEKQKIIKVSLLEQELLKDVDDLSKKIYLYIKDNKVVNSGLMSRNLNISIQDINVGLSILELKGLIDNRAGSNYSIKDEFDV